MGTFIPCWFRRKGARPVRLVSSQSVFPSHPTSIGIGIGIGIGVEEGGSGGRKTFLGIHQVPFTGEEREAAGRAKGMNLLDESLGAVGAVGEG